MTQRRELSPVLVQHRFCNFVSALFACRSLRSVAKQRSARGGPMARSVSGSPVSASVGTRIGQGVRNWIEETFYERIPGYALLRSLTHQVAGKSRGSTWKAALFQSDEALIPAFIIEELDDGRYTVFVPSIPTPFAGAVYVLDKRRVHPWTCPSPMRSKSSPDGARVQMTWSRPWRRASSPSKEHGITAVPRRRSARIQGILEDPMSRKIATPSRSDQMHRTVPGLMPLSVAPGANAKLSCVARGNDQEPVWTAPNNRGGYRCSVQEGISSAPSRC
jgi:hypothetical protein